MRKKIIGRGTSILFSEKKRRALQSPQKKRKKEQSGRRTKRGKPSAFKPQGKSPKRIYAAVQHMKILRGEGKEGKRPSEGRSLSSSKERGVAEGKKKRSIGASHKGRQEDKER